MNLIPPPSPCTGISVRNSTPGSLGVPSAKGCAKVVETSRHRGGFLLALHIVPSLDTSLTRECYGPCGPSSMTLHGLDSQTLSSLPHLRLGNSAVRAPQLGPGFPRHAPEPSTQVLLLPSSSQGLEAPAQTG